MLTLEDLDEIAKELSKDCHKPVTPIYIQTGFFGALWIDFVMSGLYFNISHHKKGKYRATINILKKDGINKIHITKNNNFVLCEGTKIIREFEKRSELYYIVEQLEKKKVLNNYTHQYKYGKN
jgi:hypothetical protein